MLNIICVKIGQKYSSEYVNNLYVMCKKNISQEFNFICYTDDPSGVFPWIQIVPFVDFELETITHNKLYIFSKEFNQQIPSGPRVFFDLDLVIKSNIDHIVKYNNKHITLIYSSWLKPSGTFNTTPKVIRQYHHNYNSSCMTWEPEYAESVWEHFTKDIDIFRYKYSDGMDPFLFWEKENIGVPVYNFPIGFFYSYIFGVDFFKNAQLCKSHIFQPEAFKHITENIPVILFNGPTTYKQYKRAYDEFYSDSISSIILSQSPK